MVTETQPVNLLSQSKKIIVFFFFSFLFFFVTLNLILFFNFATKQVTALAETAIIPSLSFSPSSVVPQLQIGTIPEPVRQNFVPTGKENSIEIAAIDITAPLVFAQSNQVKNLTEDLKKGVVVYPDSALPGDRGEITILGHSAPPFWPKIRYEWVFSKLNDLKPGDEILLNFEGRQYRYQVTKKIFLDRGEEIKSESDQNSSQFIYLLTCWPPGRDLRRLAVEAMLVDPMGLTE